MGRANCGVLFDVCERSVQMSREFEALVNISFIGASGKVGVYMYEN